MGTVTPRRLMVRKRLPMFFHNSFQPHLSATLQSDADGTSITCKFVLHPFVLAFMAVWTIGVLFIGTAAEIDAVSQLRQPVHSADVWMEVLIPPGMLIFAGLLTGGGWLLSLSDKDFLLRFLQIRLQAVPIAA